jgi:hypothetical protein
MRVPRSMIRASLARHPRRPARVDLHPLEPIERSPGSPPSCVGTGFTPPPGTPRASRSSPRSWRACCPAVEQTSGSQTRSSGQATSRLEPCTRIRGFANSPQVSGGESARASTRAVGRAPRRRILGRQRRRISHNNRLGNVSPNRYSGGSTTGVIWEDVRRRRDLLVAEPPGRCLRHVASDSIVRLRRRPFRVEA